MTVEWGRYEEAYKAIHDAIRSGLAAAPEGKKIDRIDFGYTDSNLTSLVYKDEGDNTLFTLTLSWSGGNLIKIERS